MDAFLACQCMALFNIFEMYFGRAFHLFLSAGRTRPVFCSTDARCNDIQGFQRNTCISFDNFSFCFNQILIIQNSIKEEIQASSHVLLVDFFFLRLYLLSILFGIGLFLFFNRFIFFLLNFFPFFSFFLLFLFFFLNFIFLVLLFFFLLALLHFFLIVFFLFLRIFVLILFKLKNWICYLYHAQGCCSKQFRLTYFDRNILKMRVFSKKSCKLQDCSWLFLIKKLFCKILFLMTCKQFTHKDFSSTHLCFFVIKNNLTKLGRSAYVEDENIVCPGGYHFLCILLLIGGQYLFSNCNFYIAIRIADCACISLQVSHQKLKRQSSSLFFLKLCNKIYKACRFCAVVDKAPHFFPCFFKFDNWIDIDYSKPYLIVRTDFFLVHNPHLQISPMDFVATVDLKVKSLVKLRLFVCLQLYVRFVLLI